MANNIFNGKNAASKMLSLMAHETETPAERRGFNAEDKVEEALNYFRKKKIIKSFDRFPRFSSADMEGKDFRIMLLDGTAFFVNVKNHRWYWSEEKETKDRHIRLLTVWEPDDKETTKKKVFDLIISAYLSKTDVERAREIISLTFLPKKKSFLRRILGRLRR